MRDILHTHWVIGQVVSVVLGAGLGYSLGEGLVALQIGLAAIFLLGVLIDIRYELNKLNEMSR